MTTDPRPPATDDLDALLDRAIGAARTGPEPDLTAAAKDRVRARLFTHETAADSPCATLRPQVAALLAGTLPEDRAALVDDHCRECVPCRRVLVALRDGVSEPVASPAPPTSAPRRRALAAMAAAAAVVAAVVSGALLFGRQARPATQATVAEIDGTLMVADTGAPVLLGTGIAEGVAVRTARGSRAVVTLPDGSRVELNERAQLAFASSGDALTVDLSRGDIIFEAAKRKQRNLFVTTDDCTVAVKGTVFTVRNGLKGSRIGVLEGSVHVQRQGRTSVLGPGEQAATDPSLEPQSLDELVAWSLDKDRWVDVLNEIAAAARAVEADGRAPNPRHESAILAAMPDSTVLFAAMPNDGDMARLAEEISERVAGNPKLRDWWQAQLDPTADRANFAVMLDAMRRLSDSLGEEVVFALLDDDVSPDGGPRPVLAAGVRDEGELRSLIADLAPDGHAPRMLTARDLEALDVSGEMLLVLDHGHVLASPSAAALRDIVAGFENGAPHSTGFLADLDGHYDEGAELLIAADLGRSVARRAEAAARRASSEGRDEPGRFVTALGIPDIDRFVLTAGHDDPGTAVLSFRGDRSGIAAWLAEPGPMGSLDFVTPEATVAVAALFQDPQRMLADLQSMVPEGHLEQVMAALTDDRGAVLHEELAGSLGGEMALALDGPVLPQPSWKLVLEVDDPARLDAALEGLARAAASHATPVAGALVRDEKTTEGPARALRLGATEIHYAIRDGYLVATPSLPLLEAALMAQARGTTLASSRRLLDLLPGGERDGLSLLAWEDASRLLGQLPKGASLLPDGAGQLFTTAASGGAAVGWARASDRAIVFGMNAPGGGLGTGLASLVRSTVVQALARHALTVTPPSRDDAGAPARR